MQLREIHDLILQQDAQAWHHVPSGPMFLAAFDMQYGPDPTVADVRTHTSTATYRLDVSLVIAWGLDFNQKAVSDRRADTPDWASGFVDRVVDRWYCDVLWNHQVIDRHLIATVDGGRGVVPSPNGVSLKVSPVAYALADIIGQLERRETDTETVRARAGIEVDARLRSS